MNYLHLSNFIYVKKKATLYAKKNPILPYGIDLLENTCFK